MRSVRISMRTAKTLLAMTDPERTVPVTRDEERRAIDDLKHGMEEKRHVAEHRKEKRAEDAAHRAETREIRADVMARSGGRCEAVSPDTGYRCPRPVHDMDHMFGKAKERQTVENCWGLCFQDHRLRKTDGIPAGSYWLESFALHADVHGFTTEAELARSKIPMAKRREIAP